MFYRSKAIASTLASRVRHVANTDTLVQIPLVQLLGGLTLNKVALVSEVRRMQVVWPSIMLNPQSSLPFCCTAGGDHGAR